ncbi:MAG: major capsid protein [Pseudomonadota bacterium]
MSRLTKLRVVDPVLTNLAIGYSNSSLVAESLFPLATVDKEGGKIPRFGKEAFRIYNTERALRAKSNRIQPEDIGSIDVVLDEHDLEYPIDYREDQESAFPLQAHGTMVVTEAIQLRREKMCADIAQNPANYGPGNKIALSGTSQFTHAESDPEGVIDDAKAAIRGKIAKNPNTMVIGDAAYRALKRHPKLKAILSDSRPRLVQLEDMKQIFEIPNIVIGQSLYVADSADTFTDIWGDNIILAYVPGASGGSRTPYEPSYGYTLRKKGSPQVDTRTEDGKIELIRSTDIFRPYLLGAEAGYLISDTNA